MVLRSDSGRNDDRSHFNDEILPVGASYWARMVEKLMG
jgi:hypothetical protein